MRQRNHNTAKLPRQLLEELGDSVGDHGGRRRKRGGVGGRKEQRKAERAQKKLRHTPSSRQTNSINGLSHSNDHESLNSPVAIRKPKFQATSVQPRILKPILKVPNPNSVVRQTDKAAYSPAPSPIHSNLSGTVQRSLAADDAEIAALEKALGMKNKKLPKSFESDGLDSLLDNIDDAVGLNGERPRKRKGNDEEQWLKNKRQKAQAETLDIISSYKSEGSKDGDESSECRLEEYSEDTEETEQAIDVDKLDESSVADEDNDQPLPTIIEKKTRENPYVAPITTQTIKYIPPSLRDRDMAEPQDLSRLQRQMQGLLNRLSEANMLSILGDIEPIYRNQPRQHVSTTLLDLLLSALSDPTILSDTFIILHAGFIAAVYKIIGADFGAQAIHRIDEDFNQMYTAELSKEGIGKKLINLISLLAELYNFQVVGSTLLYDYVRLFLQDLSETNTELLLRIIRIAGSQLRQDDPSSLKDIVLQLQSAVARTGEENLSPRMKFMIETIHNLKNNRMKTGAVAATITSEHTTRMKKTLGSLNARSLKASEPLRISMKDVRTRNKVGAWWLVGASYKGAVSGNDSDKAFIRSEAYRPEGNNDEDMDYIATDLLQLAKEQRMNTDIRRSIFVAVMSSSDYNDAYIRLMKLRLKRSQELEIPKVLMHCAGAERMYNPFYTFLSRRVCSDKKLKMSFQFSLWDLFKQMGERDQSPDEDQEHGAEETLELRSLVNIAKMFGVLVAEGGLSLGVLKNLNLVFLQPKTRTFLEILIITAILHSQQDSNGGKNKKALLSIFLQPKEIHQMAAGLQYFLKKVVRKTDVAGSKSDKETVKWACGVACDALTALVRETVADEYQAVNAALQPV